MKQFLNQNIYVILLLIIVILSEIFNTITKFEYKDIMQIIFISCFGATMICIYYERKK